MGKRWGRRIIYLSLWLSFLPALGCGTSGPSRFYSLSPMKIEREATTGTSPKGGINIVVGPVRLPDYLDRPQIVTRSGSNELNLAEFDRWAGALDNNINQVLVENLTLLLPRDRFFVTRPLPTLGGELPEAYSVEVLVERFEGTLGKGVELKAKWGIIGGGTMPVTKESQITERIRGRGYDDLVAAMGRTLEKLSREIAGTIVSMTKR